MGRPPSTRPDAISASIQSEVGGPDLGIGEQVPGFPFQGDPAGFEHVGPMGDLQGHLGVLLDEHDRDPGGIDLDDDLENIFDHQGRQAQGRLVKQQELGSG